MMEPPPALRISGMAALVPRKTPFAFTSITRSQSSLVVSSTVGRPLIDWARTVQQYVESECGFHLIRGLGGHGYGRTLHGPPFISNVLPSRPGEWPDAMLPLKPGMLLAVEPMLAIGSSATTSDSRKWPVETADGSLAVHYEANILITKEGPCDLTEGMDELPDIVGG